MEKNEEEFEWKKKFMKFLKVEKGKYLLEFEFNMHNRYYYHHYGNYYSENLKKIINHAEEIISKIEKNLFFPKRPGKVDLYLRTSQSNKKGRFPISNEELKEIKSSLEKKFNLNVQIRDTRQNPKK